jgi:hypothetical protein
MEIWTGHDRIDVEVSDGGHDLLKTDKIETGASTGGYLLSGGNPLCQQARRDAGNIRAVQLAGDHEDADFCGLAVMPPAAKEHVEPALIGTKRIKHK